MMKKWIVAGATALGLLVLANGRGEARPIYPWCEVSQAGGSYWMCDFATFEDCQAFARGDGFCENNPAYRPPPVGRDLPYRPRHKPRHRSHDH